MKLFRILIFIFCIISLSKEASAQIRLNLEMQNVLTLQDQRDVTEEKLNALLNHPDHLIRYRIAIACGSIQDMRLTDVLLQHQNDSNDSVRMAISFALGQTGGKQVVEKMIQQLQSEKSVEVRGKIYEALGKLADVNDLDQMIILYKQKNNPDDESGISQCLARCAIRNVVSDNCIELIKQLLQSKNDSTRYYAVYAISRFRKSKFVDPFIPEIEWRLGDTSPDVRMFAATSVGYISDSLRFFSLIMQGIRDKDWRVRVNSLLAITHSKFKLNRILMIALLRLVESKNTHVAIAVLQTLAAKIDEFEQLNSFNTRLMIFGTDFSHFKDQSVRMAAFSCFARMYPMDANDMLLSMIPFLRGVQREKCIEALGFVNHREKYFYSTNVIDALIMIPKRISDHRTVMSVLLAMNEMKSHLKNDDKKRIIDFCLKCMDSEDISLITQSAEMCSDTAFLKMNIPEIAPQARAALSKLKEVTDVEPVVALCNLLALCNDSSAIDVLKEKLRMPDKTISTAAAKALSKISGKDYMSQITVPIPPVFTDYDWDYLSAIKENETVLIRTNRGSIIVQLNVREAPFTVMRFLKLVDRKFYNNLSFHRVVSNFVVQGGDPRGDGWGGPGWTMRSEFGLNHFERGSIGIASSGKDTEGSQFFITHCATPHLDGRYTNFGKVIKGMSDIDRIQIGDKILSIDRRY